MLDQMFFALLDDDVLVKEDEDELMEVMGSLAREMDVRGVVVVEKDILVLF